MDKIVIATRSFRRSDNGQMVNRGDQIEGERSYTDALVRQNLAKHTKMDASHQTKQDSPQARAKRGAATLQGEGEKASLTTARVASKSSASRAVPASSQATSKESKSGGKKTKPQSSGE